MHRLLAAAGFWLASAVAFVMIALCVGLALAVLVGPAILSLDGFPVPR